MSDLPQGQGWWEASDGKWYAPELHPDYSPPAQPSQPAEPAGFEPPAGGYEPPRFGDRVDSMPPPQGVPGPQGGSAYPAVAPKKRSTAKILALIFGGIFLLAAGGCGVFIWSFRDEIADAVVDFADAVPVDDPATCRVTGVDFGEDYEIEATLTASGATVESHYQLTLEIVAADGDVVGSELAVFRSMEPSEERTEDVFNTITAVEPVDSVSCRVALVRRIPA